jgi:type II secretory pathway component PulJ
MWTTFFPDVIVAVVGAVIGSILTVLIAYFTFVVSRVHRETQALNSLIAEIHQRRALAYIDNPRVVPRAEQNVDYLHANASILGIKDEVRRARDQLRPRFSLQSPLVEMTRSCNRYLELSASNPDRYWFHLMELRESLMAQIETLARTKRSISVREPGGGAF